MFKSLREKLFGAKKKASDDLETDLNLEYEKFTPEERETGSLIKESHLENLFWDLELARVIKNEGKCFCSILISSVLQLLLQTFGHQQLVY